MSRRIVIEHGCISEYHDPFDCQHTRRIVLSAISDEMVARAVRAHRKARVFPGPPQEYEMEPMRAALAAALFGEAGS